MSRTTAQAHKRKRYKLFKMDGRRCLKCGTKINLTVDHIVPKALGGTWAWGNLQTLCKKCNRTKAARIAIYTDRPEAFEYVQRYEHLCGAM